MTTLPLPQAGATPRPTLFREATGGLQLARPQPAPTPNLPAAIPQEVPFLERRRIANDMARTGVHPVAIKTMVGCYAALFAVFWAIFGGPQTALTLGVITVLGVMFFGLLAGGVLISDTPPEGQRYRSFARFLRGPVRVANAVVDGREAFAQIVALPACLVLGALVLGLICKAAAAG